MDGAPAEFSKDMLMRWKINMYLRDEPDQTFNLSIESTEADHLAWTNGGF